MTNRVQGLIPFFLEKRHQARQIVYQGRLSPLRSTADPGTSGPAGAAMDHFVRGG